MSQYSINDLPDIPSDATKIALDIVNGVYLGASRNIRMINDVFCLIVEDSSHLTSQEMIDMLTATGNFFAETRGRNTPAIGNAIHLFLEGINSKAHLPPQEVKSEVFERRDKFNKQSLINKDLIANYGANIFENTSTIFAYDYSSSMIAILQELSNRELYKNILITESRDLDGGRPLVREALEMGHHVVFTIDVAFPAFLKQIDAVLFGAETVNSDGSCFNTVGSYLVSILAKQSSIPIYVATEYLKLDKETLWGNRKQIETKNYQKMLDPTNEFAQKSITYESPDLDLIPKDFIDCYITEFGVYPPSMLLSSHQNHQSLG